MQIDKKTGKQIVLISCSVIVFYFTIKNFSLIFSVIGTILGYLSPFFIGLGIAFIFNIPMGLIEKNITKLFKSKRLKRGKSLRWVRPISILLTLLLSIGIILLVMFIVIPEIGRTIESINAMLPSFIAKIEKWSIQIDTQKPQIMDQIDAMGINLENINQKFFTFMQNAGLKVMNSSFTVIGSIFSSLFKFFLGLIFSFYVLANKEKLLNQSKRALYSFLPIKYAVKIIEILAITSKTFVSFFAGQFTEALILGGMFLIGMTILGFPYTMMISVLVAFTALIPIFGAFIGCTIGAFLILVNNPMQALWFVVFFLIMQQIEGNFIYPKVVGSSVGLPAMWVLVAVTVGGSMMGIIGMLIFIPIASVIYKLLGKTINKRLTKKGIKQL